MKAITIEVDNQHPRLEITSTLRIIISPKHLAELFWNMESAEQALVFNHLAEIAHTLPTQLYFITESEELSVEGRRVMRLIGEYSNGD
jgi:hypothetical protein